MKEITPTLLSSAVSDSPEGLLLLVTSAHCAPCKAVRQLYDNESTGLLNRWALYTLAVEGAPEWAGQEGIHSAPVSRFYLKGSLVSEVRGLITRDALNTLLRQLDSGEPAEGESIRQMMEVGRWDDARNMLDSLSDEAARAPEYQRLKGMLNLHLLECPEALCNLRDSYLSALLSADLVRAQTLVDDALSELPMSADLSGRRPFLITLIDLFPDRRIAHLWRRALKSN